MKHPKSPTAVSSSSLASILVGWREREAEYKAEWREAAARGKKGEADRLAAADIAAEVRHCINELEDLIGAGKGSAPGKSLEAEIDARFREWWDDWCGVFANEIQGKHIFTVAFLVGYDSAERKAH